MSSALRNHLAGMAAEGAVCRHYLDRGYRVLAQRWRGQSGEIDLVMAHDDDVVFVEVKKSRSFSRAASLLRPAQIERLMQTAAEFLGTQPLGQLTPARFDVALVDQQGQVSILENALAA
ncbi:MAG: YraN family protein [Rhodobacteraceae bacterium]|nr:YraN family protein [Paracoccaceae bacterium]